MSGNMSTSAYSPQQYNTETIISIYLSFRTFSFSTSLWRSVCWWKFWVYAWCLKPTTHFDLKICFTCQRNGKEGRIRTTWRNHQTRVTRTLILQLTLSLQDSSLNFYALPHSLQTQLPSWKRNMYTSIVYLTDSKNALSRWGRLFVLYPILVIW